MNSSEVTDRVEIRYLPASQCVAVLLSSIVMVSVFWGLLQVDLPLVRYLRSFHPLWLEQAGNIGNRLGSGLVLVMISTVILVSGFLLKRPSLRRAGVESLMAHAIAGLSGQALKHMVGRPRPRFVHAESGFQFGPSMDTGLDSFPSGHAAASFAVATVLARHFPKIGGMMYGLACVVAVSRVVRGSHFPTDVMAGMMAGVLAGSIIAHPLRDWRQSLVRALTAFAPYLVAVFGLIWIAVHPSADEPITMIMVFTGVLSSVVGISIRLYQCLNVPQRHSRQRLAEANVLIGLGVAMTTGSALIVSLAALVSLGHWLSGGVAGWGDGRSEPAQADFIGYKAIVAELPLLLMVPFAIWGIEMVKGIVPIL